MTIVSVSRVCTANHLHCWLSPSSGWTPSKLRVSILVNGLPDVLPGRHLQSVSTQYSAELLLVLTQTSFFSVNDSWYVSGLIILDAFVVGCSVAILPYGIFSLDQNDDRLCSH